MTESLLDKLNYWVLQAIAMGVTALLIPRLRITNFTGAFIIVGALSFINATVWGAALFFSIPDSFTLHALLLFLANGVIFWLLVKLLPGIEVQGVLPAIIAPVVFTVCSLFISKYGQQIDWIEVFRALGDVIRDIRDIFQGDAVEIPSVSPATLETPSG